MKVILISIITPYRENYHATSALPYHLMVHRPANVDIEIYTFNNNHLPEDKIREVERDLRVKIQIVPLPLWFRLVFKFHLLFIRLFLKYPLHHYLTVPKNVVNEIKSKKIDVVWVYGEELSLVIRQFDSFRRIHTLPDSEALYYHRMMGTRFVLNDRKKYWRCAFMYPKFRHMERDMERDMSVTYHLVGDADARFLRDMASGIDAHFIRHPHYDVLSREGQIHFHSPIRLLIAGQYNYYMQQDADELIAALMGNANISVAGKTLNKCYEITFLGKGWEHNASMLNNSGWDVNVISFAPDYIQEVSRHDIQLSPISIGTGTKGKVLDAFANGLMVIGTPYALENIAVRSGESCIEYHSADEAIVVLRDIPLNISEYEQMAKKGRNIVLTEHSRKKIAMELFGSIIKSREKV